MRAASSVGSAFELEGVAGYIGGRAAVELREPLARDGAEWIGKAFAAAAERVRAAGTIAPGAPDVMLQDPALGDEVRSRIAAELRAWLPQRIEEAIARDLLGGGGDAEARDEAAAIAKRAAQRLAAEQREAIEAIAATLYEQAVAKIRDAVKAQKLTSWLDITDLKGSLRDLLQVDRIADAAASQLSRAVGDATVAAIRARITDAMRGALPPEAVEALSRGPEAFEHYVAEMKRFLPGAQLRNLTSSLLNRPLLKIPTAAYAAMLAASAAGHFARAFKGIVVDPYEIQRGQEVVRVLVWQVQHKRWINLSLMQLASLSRSVAELIGRGADFEAIIGELKEPIERLQRMADRVDALVAKPLEEVQRDLRTAVDELKRELTALQERIVKPVRELRDRIQEGLDEVRERAEAALPEGFNGLPATWGELTGQAAVPAPMPLGPDATIAEDQRVPAEHPSLSPELDPVVLSTGEYVQSVTDFLIPGRGVHLRFTRTFRGHGNFLGEFGWNWTHAYAQRLLPSSDGDHAGMAYVDAEGQKFLFRREGDDYRSPPGMKLRLLAGPEGFELRAPDGSRTEFDVRGRLLQIRDRFGNAIECTYGPDGLLASVVDPFGRAVAIERRADGLIAGVRDFAGRRFLYAYNDAQELVGVASPPTPDFPTGTQSAYRYSKEASSLHALRFLLDPFGALALENRYDDRNRLVAQRYGKAPWTRVVYGGGDADGRVGSRAWVTDALGITRVYEHDAAGHLIARWRLEGEKPKLLERFVFSDVGERTERCFPSGRCEAIAASPDPADDSRRRNAYGQVVEEVDRQGAIVRYEYYDAEDPEGDGFAVHPERAGAGGGYLRRLQRGDRVTEFSYDATGNLVRVASEGRTVRYRVDGLNRIVGEETGDGIRVRYAFDANGNVVRAQHDGGGRAIVRTIAYDVLDRPVVEREEERGVVRERRFAYDAAGRLVSVVLPTGELRTFEYDADGRLRCATRKANALERIHECFERDEDGAIVAVIDGEGVRWSVAPGSEALGSALPALGDEAVFGEVLGEALAYDGRGKVVGKVDRNGTATTMRYDAAGRMIERRLTPAVGIVGTTLQRFAYDERGRLIGALDFDEREPQQAVNVHIRYDEDGRPVAEEVDGRILQRSFDDTGREVELRTPSGERLFLMRDAEGAIETILHDGTRIELSPSPRQTIGAVDEEAIAPGVVRHYRRDDRGRLVEATDRRDARSGGKEGNILRRWNYTYDEDDNVIPEGGGADPAARVQDANGNVVARGDLSLRYDGFNRLTEVWRGEVRVARYRYDAFDRRVEKRIGGEVGRFTWDGWRLLEVALPRGTTTFLAGEGLGAPAAAIVGGSIVRLTADRRGSIVGDTMQARGLTAPCLYAPYGARDEACSTGPASPLGFAAQIHDDETGLISMRQRSYDPERGQFLTPDPLGDKALHRAPARATLGPHLAYHQGLGLASRATLPNRPLSASPEYDVAPFDRIFVAPLPAPEVGEKNLYRYARNDPSTYLDPFGLASLRYDRSAERLELVGGDELLITTYLASNRVTRPNADPYAPGGNGPFPRGTFAIGIPEFYSDDYRNDFYRRFGLGEVQAGESAVTGPRWAGATGDHSVSQGRIRFRAGAEGAGDEARVWSRGLFIHGGRDNNYQATTLGCIRARDDELETLAANFIALRRQGDAVTAITVEE